MVLVWISLIRKGLRFGSQTSGGLGNDRLPSSFSELEGWVLGARRAALAPRKDFVDSCLANLYCEAKRLWVLPFHNVKADFVRGKVITIVSIDYDDVMNMKSTKAFHHYRGPRYRRKPHHLALRMMIKNRDVTGRYDI